ncbi:membrane spanning protein [Bifidobacterium breve]|nr:membrane spanning protein [Bifidobacterium breve]
MKFAPIIDPAVRKPAPKPVRVDLRKAFGMGTGLWAVALVIALILLAFNHSTLPLVIMCAAGVIIGVLAADLGTLRPLGLPPSRSMIIGPTAVSD